jgi:prophage regulatory protein
MLEQSRSPVTLLRRKQFESRTGLSRSSIYKLISEGNFPKPIKLGQKGVAWVTIRLITGSLRRLVMPLRSKEHRS